MEDERKEAKVKVMEELRNVVTNGNRKKKIDIEGKELTGSEEQLA